MIALEFGLNTPPLSHFKKLAPKQGGGGGGGKKTSSKKHDFLYFEPRKISFHPKSYKIGINLGGFKKGGYLNRTLQ